MKPSRFNHFFPINGGETILAYNSFSGALAEIEKDQYPRILELLADPRQTLSPQDQEFVQCLKDGEFLIPDGVDQVGTIRQVARRGRTSTAVQTLTIVPTFACNFDCPYCFESRTTGVMTPEVQDALVQFADRQLARAEAFRVMWFGGEPTLCFPLLERLQGRLLDLAAKRRVEVMPGRITTNGYLVDGAMAQRLKDLRIELAQITIDGPQEIHDSRRRLKNGKGSFQRIIENLTESADILKIKIRINVDRTNIETACQVVELLDKKGILPKVSLYIGHLVPMNACADLGGYCYTDHEFSQVLVDLYRRLLDSGFQGVEYPEAVTGGGYCSSFGESHYVVSPTGLLFRCAEELSSDPNMAIGDIFSSTPTDAQRKNLESYRTYDPFKFSDCLECSVLPLCFGGCPKRAKEKVGSSRGDCVLWKYNLADMVELNYRAGTGQPTA